MLRWLIEQSGTAIFAELAMVIFVAVFLGALLRLYFTPRQETDAMAQLPLADDSRPHHEDVP